MAKQLEVLNRNWHWLKDLHPGILNVTRGEKWVNGINTHRPAITVFVQDKLPASALAPNEIIPPEIEGISTDVIELKPQGWTPGKTSVSEMHPLERKRKLGLIYENPPLYRATTPTSPVTNFQVDWSAKANPIGDQLTCGICPGFGTTGVWEAAINIQTGILPKLSESHLFFCAGGTCEAGGMMTKVLNQAKKGVALEQDLPYRDVDQKCGQGLAPDWYLRGKALKSWQATMDVNQMKSWLMAGPLVTIMTVHSSFFNYTGGIYINQGATDPIEGGHCIGEFGGNDVLVYWGPIRNSWNTTWGEKGWARISQKDTDFGTIMYLLVPSTAPIPIPVPRKKKGFLCNIFGACAVPNLA